MREWDSGANAHARRFILFEDRLKKECFEKANAWERSARFVPAPVEPGGVAGHSWRIKFALWELDEAREVAERGGWPAAAPGLLPENYLRSAALRCVPNTRFGANLVEPWKQRESEALRAGRVFAEAVKRQRPNRDYTWKCLRSLAEVCDAIEEDFLKLTDPAEPYRP